MTPIAALQAALTVEHQVVYGYGVVGARMSARADLVTRDECVERLDRHRALRDTLTELVRGAGGTPVISAPAYDLPFPVRTSSDVVRLAVVLEDAVAGAMWDLAQATAAGTAARRSAVAELARAATWAARWRESGYPGDQTQPALPGAPQLAPDIQPSTSSTSSVSESTTPSGSTS